MIRAQSTRLKTLQTRFGLMVVMAFALASLTLLSMPAAHAATPHGDRQPGGPQGGTTSGSGSTFVPAVDDAGSAAENSIAITTSDLNLRAGPSVESEIATVMPLGSSVEITGAINAGFYPVTFNGISGYAYAGYLSIGGTAPTAGTASTGTTTMAGAGQSDIVAIIYAAADAYGQSREDMLRVATCESGLDPNNVTPPYDASGLFQFLPSTWASTPFANENIFDPVASANATAWMWSVGRRGEWVCQ